MIKTQSFVCCNETYQHRTCNLISKLIFQNTVFKSASEIIEIINTDIEKDVLDASYFGIFVIYGFFFFTILLIVSTIMDEKCPILVSLSISK